MPNAKAIDEENGNFYSQNKEAVTQGKLKTKDILGFEMKDATVFVSSPRCGFVSSKRYYCSSGENAMSIFSLLPLYDSIVYPISPVGYQRLLVTQNNFSDYHNIAFRDFLELVYKHRVIPYFGGLYSQYDKELIEPFLETGGTEDFLVSFRAYSKH